MKIKILGIFVCLMLISAVPSVLSVHLANEYNLTGKNIAMKGGVTNVENNVDDIGWYTSLALDENGFPHISYYDYTNGDLKYACFNGIDWSTEVVDSAGNVGRYTSIELDDNDHPHISYYDYTNGDLKYAYFTDSRWNTETIDSWGDVGLYTSVALDSQDYPHISYCDYSKRTLKYAHWTGATWKKTVVDKTAIIAAGEYFGDYTSIAVDGNDFPHISYCDFENYDLKYAHYTGNSWNKEVVDSKGSVGQYSSIAIDDDDSPHITELRHDYAIYL